MHAVRLRSRATRQHRLQEHHGLQPSPLRADRVTLRLPHDLGSACEMAATRVPPAQIVALLLSCWDMSRKVLAYAVGHGPLTMAAGAGGGLEAPLGGHLQAAVEGKNHSLGLHILWYRGDDLPVKDDLRVPVGVWVRCMQSPGPHRECDESEGLNVKMYKP